MESTWEIWKITIDLQQITSLLKAALVLFLLLFAHFLLVQIGCSHFCTMENSWRSPKHTLLFLFYLKRVFAWAAATHRKCVFEENIFECQIVCTCHIASFTLLVLLGTTSKNLYRKYQQSNSVYTLVGEAQTVVRAQRMYVWFSTECAETSEHSCPVESIQSGQEFKTIICIEVWLEWGGEELSTNDGVIIFEVLQSRKK